MTDTDLASLRRSVANVRFREVEPGWRGQGVTAVVMNPGFVQTSLSGGFGYLTPVESATAIKRVLERMTPADAGKFLEHNGTVLPW